MTNRDKLGRFVKGHQLPGPGAPTTFDPAVAAAALEWMSAGKSLASFCREHPEAPPRPTILTWAAKDIGGFAEPYRAARRTGAEAWADTLVDECEAELGSNSMPAVAARQLAINTKKWLMTKICPEQYGERVQVAHDHRCDVVIWLPGKPKPGDSARVIEGSAQAVEDGREDE